MSAGWVKPLYYYLVMLISLFFFVVSVFGIARTYYIANFSPRLAETEIQTLIPYQDNRCYERSEPVSGSEKGEFKTIPVDREKCNQQIAEYRGLWVEQNITWAVIALILSSLVMITHYFLIGRNLKEEKAVTKQSKKN